MGCYFLDIFIYAIATLFQLYFGSDMMYEMRRKKPESTLLPTDGIFNLPHHIGMVTVKIFITVAVHFHLNITDGRK